MRRKYNRRTSRSLWPDGSMKRTLSDIVMSFPSKEQRSKCWSARDNYWECLDKNPSKPDDKKDINVCAEFRKMYEQSCSAQWVKHFDRKRNYLIFKEKIEKEGIPTKNKDESSLSLPRRIYHQIVVCL